MVSQNRTVPEEDEGPDYGQPLVFDADFQGPTRKRKCTDVVCLGLFVAFLAGWGFVAYIGMTQGDINKVIYPTDSSGHICGQGEYKSRPYLLFFDLTKCLNPAVLTTGCGTPQVCVAECPVEDYSGYAEAKLGLNDKAKAEMRPYCATMPDNVWRGLSAIHLIEQGLCPAWTLSSKPFLGRCLPALKNTETTGDHLNSTIVPSEQTVDHKKITGSELNKALTAFGAFLSVRNFGERVFNDLSETWWMIGLALIGACILSFFWIVLMRFVAGIMIWVSVFLVFAMITSLFGYSLYRYIIIKDEVSAQGSILEVNFTPDYMQNVLGLRDTWLAFTIILAIVDLIILLVLIALRQRILIAIQLIEQASKAVGQMFTSLLFPIVPFILHLTVVLWFLLVALYLASAGVAEYRVFKDQADGRAAVSCAVPCINPATNNTYNIGDKCQPAVFNKTCAGCPEVSCVFTKYVKSNDASWMQWFNLFGLFWGLNFVSGIGELVLAGVFATWYWTWDKKDVPILTLGRSFCYAFGYHLGTIAFGSLIIAIIRFIRAILTYVENKLKRYHNDLTRCLLCLCKCCLYCLEKFMRFINRNAYIMCAIKSTNFCVSAKQAFNLLMRNILRVLVLNKVVDFLLFLGKLVIVAGSGTLTYFVFSGGISEIKDEIPTLNYYFTPIVCITLGSYVIANSFFGVYAMAVDTLFLCFLEDLERNDGTPSRPYFMSRGLRKVIGKMQKIQDDNQQHLRSPR